MTFDKPMRTDSLALTLEALQEAETEERAALERMRPLVVDPKLEETIDIELLAVQRMLDSKWMARIQTITARDFGKLTAVEQRTWLGRAERIAKRFAEQASMMRRNARAEPQLPDYLKVG